jgi:hypothetical protein
MKIKISDLNRLIREAVTDKDKRTMPTPEEMFERRSTAVEGLVERTKIGNALDVLEGLLRTAQEKNLPIANVYPIPGNTKIVLDQEKIAKQIRNPKVVSKLTDDDIREMLKTLYVLGNYGKILGSDLSPNTLQFKINNPMKASELDHIQSDEEESASEASEGSEDDDVLRKYLTKAQAGGKTFEEIADILGISVQRAKQIFDKGLERVKGKIDKNMRYDASHALPAITEFIDGLDSATSLSEFVNDVLKLEKPSDGDLELIMVLKHDLEDGKYEEAKKRLYRRYKENDNTPLMNLFHELTRASDKPGRPSANKIYFKENSSNFTVNRFERVKGKIDKNMRYDASHALPAIEEFIAKLVDAESVTEFVMRTLKLPRATEADIEFLVELKEIAEDNEASAVKVLMDRFMENDNSHLMRRIQDALRPEGAGRPSKIRTYFK